MTSKTSKEEVQSAIETVKRTIESEKPLTPLDRKLVQVNLDHALEHLAKLTVARPKRAEKAAC